MKKHDRRQELRHEIQWEVAVVTDQAYSLSATAVEISAAGIRVKTVKALLPGTQVAIFLKLEDEIQIRGTVLWTLCGVEKGLSIYQVGINTDAIVQGEIKATQYADKQTLVQEILYYIKEMENRPV